MSAAARLAGSLAAGLLLVLLFVTVLSADGPTCPVPLTDRQRFGFVAVGYATSNWPQTLDYGSLNAGWVVDFAFQGYNTPPQGLDRALVLRTREGYVLDPDQLGPLVENHPGAMWLLGNEPDRRGVQDSVEPEEYARIYHDIYTFIKNRDSTSQISPGGVVQPTPLRLQYLDRVLAAYQARYGQAMPVDVWNIHNAILNEVSCDYDPGNCWGAGIPPGLDDPYGQVRTIDDNDNMTMFRDQIWAFRQWMADNGYGDHPLIVSEYGILMPESFGFDAARVATFMDATFDFFMNSTDPTLGDPNDGYRLVQRWAWFSLDWPAYQWPSVPNGFNGNLFDPETKARTPHGDNYADYTSSFSPVTYVDLGVGGLRALPTSDLASPTQTITRSVQVKVVNLGTVNSGGFTVTLGYAGPVSGQLEEWIGDLPRSSSQSVIFELSNLEPGSYDVAVALDPDAQVPESRECNNQATITVLAPTHRSYLPLVASRAAGGLTAQAALDLSSQPGTQSPSSPGEVVPGFQHFQPPTADSYPAQIALDGNGVWITLRDGNKIAYFDPQTEIWEEYPIPTAGSQPWGLALDGNGNLWFTEMAANQIAKLEISSGTITEYAIPTPNSQPWKLAIENNGTVWFTEKEGNKIAKLEPSTGAVTEYPVPTANSEPADLGILHGTYGSYIWFTESAANRLGRLSSATGSIQDPWQPGTADSIPQDIVLVVAGEPILFFTETGGNNIATCAIGTNFRIDEIPVQTPNSEPYGLALELEGSVIRTVWFTERAANKLGHFDEQGNLREYSLPAANGLPTDVAVDADGCAWYTAPGANQIGRLCLPFPHQNYLPLVFKND